MREILFRGKRADNKEWEEGYGFCDEGLRGKIVVYYDTFTDEEGEETHYYDFVEVITRTAGQYTGLKDKNGTRIFEGDIVHVFIERRIDFTGIVKYEEECAYFCMDDILDENQFTEFCHYNSSQLEVIGNIYDNPELIPNK